MEAVLAGQKEAAEAAKREHELELATLYLAATNSGGCTAERDDRAKPPKLPAFVDGKNDLDAYL